MKTQIYIARQGLRHDTGPGHPERPERLETLLDLFDNPVDANMADRDLIRLVHSAAHIEKIEDAIPAFGLDYLDGDTVLSPHSLDAALQASGAVVQAVTDIAAQKITRAFCAVRPPGHHAETDRAMGFCLFNNIFIGARHAQNLGFEKIAIMDFDVHHGNGTDEMARKAQNILYASTHEWPLFPGTGHPQDNVPGQIANAILPSGANSSQFRKIVQEDILPAIDSFSPDLLMISAGFDAHKDDPLASIQLTEDDFFWITKELCTLADKHAKGRVVSVLEGGYNLQALKNSVSAHLDALNQ